MEVYCREVKKSNCQNVPTIQNKLLVKSTEKKIILITFELLMDLEYEQQNSTLLVKVICECFDYQNKNRQTLIQMLYSTHDVGQLRPLMVSNELAILKRV